MSKLHERVTELEKELDNIDGELRARLKDAKGTGLVLALSGLTERAQATQDALLRAQAQVDQADALVADINQYLAVLPELVNRRVETHKQYVGALLAAIEVAPQTRAANEEYANADRHLITLLDRLKNIDPEQYDPLAEQRAKLASGLEARAARAIDQHAARFGMSAFSLGYLNCLARLESAAQLYAETAAAEQQAAAPPAVEISPDAIEQLGAAVRKLTNRK